MSFTAACEATRRRTSPSRDLCACVAETGRQGFEYERAGGWRGHAQRAEGRHRGRHRGRQREDENIGVICAERVVCARVPGGV